MKKVLLFLLLLLPVFVDAAVCDSDDIENAKKCAELAKKNFKKAKNSEGMDGCDRLLSSIAGQSEQQE